jgi:hypothetical protein
METKIVFKTDGKFSLYVKMEEAKTWKRVKNIIELIKILRPDMKLQIQKIKKEYWQKKKTFESHSEVLHDWFLPKSFVEVEREYKVNKTKSVCIEDEESEFFIKLSQKSLQTTSKNRSVVKKNLERLIKQISKN